MLLFVYGTLMKKCRSNDWSRYLQRNSIFKGEAFCDGKLYLVSTFPGLVLGEGKVFGEVYEIKENMEEVVHLLDQYEDYRADNEAESLYLRRIIKCELLDSKESLECSTYIYNRPVQDNQLIGSGRFNL